VAALAVEVAPRVAVDGLYEVPVVRGQSSSDRTHLDREAFQQASELSLAPGNRRAQSALYADGPIQERARGDYDGLRYLGAD